MEVGYDQRQYYEEVHRVTVKRGQGEPLGLTVKVEGECVMVSRILDGGLIDRTGQIDLGDIVVEVGGTPIQTVDDLMYQVAQSGTKITFLVKKTPPEDLKKLSISQTPSLRKAMNQKANPEQKVLCYVKALFNYDPKEDNIHPCAEIGLMFFTGDILAIVNQDDPNWWQARLAECPGPSGLIPSRELEERRKAYVDKESDYTTKIGLCGTFIAKKKKKKLYQSRGNTQFDRAELCLYEEVVKLPPFKRKTLILIGANGVGRRTLKSKLLDRNPDRFASPLPQKKNLEESAKLQRAYANYFDLIVVNESWEDTYTKIMNALDDVEHEASWVPAKWVYS